MKDYEAPDIFKTMLGIGGDPSEESEGNNPGGEEGYADDDDIDETFQG